MTTNEAVTPMSRSEELRAAIAEEEQQRLRKIDHLNAEMVDARGLCDRDIDKARAARDLVVKECRRQIKALRAAIEADRIPAKRKPRTRK